MTRNRLPRLTAFALAGLSACAAATPAVPPPAATAPLSQATASTRTTIAGPEASPITFERMSKWPEPGLQVPRSIAFSPDGKSITFLQSEKQNDETALFSFDRASKEVRVLLRASDL